MTSHKNIIDPDEYLNEIYDYLKEYEINMALSAVLEISLRLLESNQSISSLICIRPGTREMVPTGSTVAGTESGS